MGGDTSERHAFIRDATHVMAVEAVIDIVKAAAEAGGQTISHGLVRMLAKLAAHAEFGEEAARPMADGALREQVGQLLDDWQLADPNPESYGQMLEHISTTAAAAGAREDGAESSLHPDPVRLVQISLESGGTGPLIERAIDQGLAQGRAADLLAVLTSAPDESSPAAEALRLRLLWPDTLRALLNQSPVDFDGLDRLQPFLSIAGYEVLLDALATADNRTTRRKLLDRLGQAPFDLGPAIVTRLGDDRWFVQRNMLVLLERTGRPPEGFSVAPWVAHPDVRVRHEAIRLQLTLPAERNVAVRAALEDGHPRLVHSGLAAIQQECPPIVADLVAHIAGITPAEVESRVLAARALGRCRDRRALPVLLGLVDGGRTFFGRSRLSAQSPVMLAAAAGAGDRLGHRSARGGASESRARIRGHEHSTRRASRCPVSDPVRFLNAFGHALAVMTLYPEGHPSREGAVDDAFQELDAIAAATANPSFTFLDDEVVFGREPLRDLKVWEWGRRLVSVGVQRMELERRVSRDEFEGFLQEIFARLNPSTGTTSENRQMRTLGIRFGAVGLQQGQRPVEIAVPSTTLELTLGEEAETLRWLQQRVQRDGTVPLIEAEAVVRSLSVAMHGDRRMVLPLLQLKEFDQYTTTHALNVAVLSMGLAEALSCGAKEVRAFGVAGLLHDIGKTRIPLEVLTKPGRLTDQERTLMNAHPVDGARIIMQSHDDLDLAAVVAYEHHIMIDGGGYPRLHYPRECTLASRLVHVCDVYDALRTNRPYRDAWSNEKTIAYLQERAGTEFDGAVVTAFVKLLQAGEAQVRRTARRSVDACVVADARAADRGLPPASEGHLYPCGLNRYPTQASVTRYRGWAGSSSTFLRNWPMNTRRYSG